MNMPNLVFSQEMKNAMKTPGARKIWLVKYDSVNTHNCTNCGGIGYLYLFIAKGGPFENSPTTGIGSYFDGRWWVGQHFPFVCPVCKNEAQ
jgi:rubrerythrin